MNDQLSSSSVVLEETLGDSLDATVAYSLVATVVMGEQGGIISTIRGVARDIILSAGEHVLKVVFMPDRQGPGLGSGLGRGLGSGSGPGGYYDTTSTYNPDPSRVESSVCLTILRQKTKVIWDKHSPSPGAVLQSSPSPFATSPGPSPGLHADETADGALALGSVLTRQHLTARVVGVGTVGAPPGDTLHSFPLFFIL